MKRSVIACTAALALLTGVPAYSETPLAVEIVVATMSVEQQTFSLTGEIRPRESLMAAFPIGGRVTEVLADLGAKVESNAPLARLDSIQQELALRTAEAGLRTAQADHLQAIEDLRRAEALLASGATTRATRDATDDALRAAEGALELAEADWDRATKALADTVLRAPSASTVISRMIEPGQIIGAAQTAMELALDKGFEAVFEVPEAMLIGEAPSSGIVLSRFSKPEEGFGGRLTEVSPLIDPKTGTVAAKVEVLDPPVGLGFGEPVRGTASRPAEAQVSLPYTSMSATADGPAVWRVDQETMHVVLQPVEIDRYETGRFLLSGGVEEGDWIVTKGAQLLYPGRLVRRVGEDQ
ncbi:RND family efflux transporter, MFP subunit [Hoeflea sp. IMCC20628]|uniref:efflux RND transporter periplasmic adaptor subunit n=1 Tax=Hoeflea sp. IMCC20628 TaxID=1620421 RepID=UPI00063BDB82|nr:efflux RND transporter periplasmic adaptor subunit [Hoeflea sp. IMCC20628]AKH98986.1 RND family efflux transporter, MFP subunit [Hoeflea sp. IMCC20628]